MKKFTMTLIFISLLGAFVASGKENDIITIIDQETKEPIPAATVTLFCKHSDCKSDNKKMMKADNNGQFVNPFSYPVSVTISCVGYLRYSFTLKKNPGKIFLKPTVLYMNPIVTTGQYTPRSTQKSVYPVKVIGNERIKEQAATNLRELMTTESNIRLSQDGVLGSSMSLNGISGENIKILIDGVPVIGRMNGSIDLSQINLNNIERVEIIEGPMSSVYGSDALGGVINLISKDRVKPGTSAQAESYYESVGKVNLNGGFDYFNNNWKLGVNAGRNFFNGYSENEHIRSDEWSPKEQYFVDLNASKKIGNHTIKYQGSYFDEYILKRYEPYDFYKERAFDDRFYTDRLTNSLFYNAKVFGNYYLNATANYSYFKRTRNKYSIDRTNLSEILVSDLGSQDTSIFNTYVFRSTLSSDNLTDFLAYQLGIDYKYDDATGQKIEGNSQEISDYSVFGGLQYSPYETFTLQPTFRFSENTKYDAPITYAMNVKYTIIDNLTFRATYGKGFRAPSLKELYLDFVDSNHEITGNKELDAEESKSINAGIEYNAFFSGRLLKVEPKFFFNQIDNKIELVKVDPNSERRMNQNISKFKSIGTAFNVSFFSDDYIFKLGYNYTGRYNQLSESNAEAAEYSFSHDFQANFSWLVPYCGTRMSIFYKYTGKLPYIELVDNNVEEFFIEDFHTLDLTFNRKFFEYLTLNFGAKNLFDVKSIFSGASSGGVHSGGGNSLVNYGRTYFISIGVDY